MKKTLIIFSFFLLGNVGCTLSDPEMMELLQEIKAQNDKLLQEVEAMKGQLSLLDGKYQVILASLADNKKELEALKSQIDALKAQIAQQLIKINQLSVQIEESQGDLVKLSAEIAELKASIEELKGLIEELLGQIAPKIGDEYAGGIVFYLDATSLHGLVVSKVNLSNGSTGWGCYCQDIKNTKSAVGTGAENTKEMLSQCLDSGAAKTVDNYISEGYTDWFLPSKDELNLVYLNVHKNGLGSFSATVPYWSSTQTSYGSCGVSGGAWTQNFGSGGQIQEYKNGYQGTGAIRAVRSF
jgi:cell division protein FtsB